MLVYDKSDGEIAAVLPIRRSFAELPDGPKDRLAQLLMAIHEVFGFEAIADLETEYEWTTLPIEEDPDKVWFIVYKLPAESQDEVDETQKPPRSRKSSGGISEDDLK
jgi:hypothetical protein